MKRSFWFSLFIVAVITLNCAVSSGQRYADCPESMDTCSTCFDYCGCSKVSCKKCLCSRERLFGDWCGLGPRLVKRGIIPDLQLTQFYQGTASGGAEQTDAYGGKMDYQFTFLGEPLGLWKGFTTILHAETRFGDSINTEAGAFAFPNLNMLYPLPGQQTTAITGLILMQALSEQWAIAAGKINVIDLWQMIYPNTGRGIDGFMNLSLVGSPTFLRTTNLSVNGAGLLRMSERRIQSGVIVYDTNNSSTTDGFGDLFDKGAVILGYWRFFTQMNGLPGSHGFLGNYSTRKYTSVDPLSWTIIPGQGLQAGRETGSWALAYVLDQVIWADRCNKDRNLNLMSQWALADGNPSPVRWSFNVAIQGQGLLPGRQLDTMGVGYFYDQLSSDFKRLVSRLPNRELRNVQGVELYYNAAITPWLRLTGDMQIVENENIGNDTALILGLRAKIAF